MTASLRVSASLPLLLVSVALASAGCLADPGAGSSTPAPAASSTPGPVVPPVCSYEGCRTASPASPPQANAGAPAPEGGPATFVLDSVALGADTPDACQVLGYDLDGYRYPSNNVAGHCRTATHVKSSNDASDGPNGVDNSFARNVVPMLLGLASDFPASATDGLGASSLVLRVDALGAGDDYASLSGDAAPSVLDDTGWHPYAGYAPPREILPRGWMTNGTVVLTGGDTVSLRLGPSTVLLALHVHRPIVTFRPSHDRTHASDGVLAGIVPVSELVALVRADAGQSSKSLCAGSALDGVIQQIEDAADVLLDGTQDETRDCDAVSIGIGFTAKRAELDVETNAAFEAPDVCAM